MTILQNGLDIQRFSQTAPELRAQLLLLDFQVDESFQFILWRAASVFREHGYYSNCSAAGNLDTFHFAGCHLACLWSGPPFIV